MPRPSELAADARALYGPVASRPAAADVGDGALWVDPGSGHALYQVQSGNWVQIGVGTAPPAPPAGLPVLYGPYAVDYTAIPHDGDTLVLWTPAVGDVLLRLFEDVATAVAWDQGSVGIGQNVDITGSPFLNVLATATSGHWGAHDYGWLDSVLDAASQNAEDATGGSNLNSAYVFHTTDPVQIQLAQTGGTDPTAGHVDLYALVARAVAP